MAKILEKREVAPAQGFNADIQVRVVELAAGVPVPDGAKTVDDAAPVTTWTSEKNYVPYVAPPAEGDQQNQGAA